MFPPQLSSLYLQAFSLVRHNLLLFIPFFLFLFVTGFLLMPGGSVLFLLVAGPVLAAVLLAGWLNMFKKCVETPVDENLEEEKRTEDSLMLFREFFPGVGKYFTKIALGVLIYFFLMNIYMLVVETLLMLLLGNFESFSQNDLANAMGNTRALEELWERISHSDRVKLMGITALETVFSLTFAYLTMFWSQLVVIDDIYPIKALVNSYKLIRGDFLNTFFIFMTGAGLVFAVIALSATTPANPLLQLVILISFVFAIIYFLMLTFLYLEKYTRDQRINSNSGANSLR